MTDLVERLRKNQCPENHGCGTQPQCVCADMKAAADELYSIFVDLGAPGTHAPGIANRLSVVRAKLTDALQSTPPTVVALVIEAARAVLRKYEFDNMLRKSIPPYEICRLQEALAGLDGGRK